MNENKKNELILKFWHGGFDDMTIGEVKKRYPEYFKPERKKIIDADWLLERKQK